MSGINYDFMEKVGQELNLKVEWAAEVGSGDAVQALNSSKFDMMCTSMWPDPGRLSQTEYTIPTYYSAVVLFFTPEKTFSPQKIVGSTGGI